MNCSEVRELLSPMTDREISPEDIKRIQEHLQSCKECAFRSTMMVGMKNLLRHWAGVRASGEFRAKVLQRVSQEPPPGLMSQLSPRVWMSILAACAAVGLTVAFVVTSGRSSGPDATKGPDAGGNAAGGQTRPEGAPGAGAPADPVAQMLATEGAVHVAPPDGGAALASKGDVLAPGYAVRVQDKGHADLSLVAGFEMRIESGGEMVFDRGAGPCVRLEKGRMLVRAATGEARIEPLKVRCAATTIEFGRKPVLCLVEIRTDRAHRVVVAAGSASVTSPAGSHVLDGGQMTDVGPDGTIRQFRAPAAEDDMGHLKRWGPR